MKMEQMSETVQEKSNKSLNNMVKHIKTLL